MGGALQLWFGASLVVAAASMVFYRMVSKRETLAVQDTKKIESKHGDLAELLNKTTDASERENILEKFRGAVNDGANKTIGERKSGRRLRRLLEQGDSKLRPGEWVVMTLGVALLVGIIAALARSGVVGIIGFVLVWIGSYVKLVKAVGKRRDNFANQLSDILQMVSVSLRSGMSLPQAVQMVADEAPSPTGEEFRRVMAEQRVGRDLTESFRAMAARMESKDFEWVTSAIDINRSVGGDLAQILTRVEKTIRARNKVRGQVKAMSAEGKMSGAVLCSLPPGMLFMISLINPEFVEPLFEEKIGWALLFVAGSMLSMGWFWLSKLSTFQY